MERYQSNDRAKLRIELANYIAANYKEPLEDAFPFTGTRGVLPTMAQPVCKGTPADDREFPKESKTNAPQKRGLFANVFQNAKSSPRSKESGADFSFFAEECMCAEEPQAALEEQLSERIKHMSDSFAQYLFYLIDSKGMENIEVYKRALVDKKVFSKIKNNTDYHPQKLTALCLCVGACLSLDETKDLLARAGYALSPCDKTDIIFSYFIENEIYDMIEIDIQLEEYGLPCIIA